MLNAYKNMKTKSSEIKSIDYSCNSKSLTFNKPLLMAIVNITPDSFYDGGKYSNVNDVLRDIEEKIKNSENKIQEALGGHTKITVLVDDEETTFEMSQKQTILDAALKQGIDAPYSCQGGICSSCMARVTVGTAEMKKNSILTDKELAEGLVLTCQAHPTSDTIFVDFDDV